MSAIVEDRETAKARNRAEFPKVAAIMDECRAAFGPDVKMAHVVEGGRELGKPIDDAGLVRCTQLAPPSARCERFRVQAAKVFAQKFYRAPRASGDGDWCVFYSEYAAQHWPAFSGGDT